MNELLNHELKNLPAKYNSMKILDYREEIWFVSGKFELDASFDQVRIRESILLQMEIPDSFPLIPPKIKELGNRLSYFPHINPDGYFCLGTPEVIGNALSQSTSLVSFLDKVLVSYLYCAFYYLKHNKEPFPCASHGFLGRLEEYCMIFNTNDPIIAYQFMNFVENGSELYSPCPCLSGKSLKDCHWQKIKEIRKMVTFNN